MRQKWSGVVELNDGNVDIAYQKYQGRLQLVAGLGLKSRIGREAFLEDLSKILTDLLKYYKEFATRVMFCVHLVIPI